MPDPLAELKRRAYTRPDGTDDPLAAQAELASIALERDREARGVDIPIPVPPRFSVLGRRGRYVLAAMTVAAVAAAGVTVATRPVDSLQVFAREPSAADHSAPDWASEVLGSSRSGADTAIVDSLRWLGDYKQSRLFGYQMESGAVCLFLVTGDSAAGDCATASEFAEGGATLESMRRPDTEREYISVQWGPLGGPQFSDGPPDEASP